jgi:hypothetical protein
MTQTLVVSQSADERDAACGMMINSVTDHPLLSSIIPLISDVTPLAILALVTARSVSNG